MERKGEEDHQHSELSEGEVGGEVEEEDNQYEQKITLIL